MTGESFRPALWLRWLGTATFIGGGLAFLVEGWSDESTLARSISWAAATVSLTVLGITALKRFRDVLGARLFLGLAAATVPIHFALVGAATWSWSHEYAPRRNVQWVACVTAALLPVLMFGISVLSRRRRLLVTSLLICFALPLVPPTRDGDTIAIVGLSEAILLVSMELLIWRRDPSMQTAESLVTRSLLFVPLAILLVRNVYYPVTEQWVAAIVASPSLVLLALPRVRPLRGEIALFCQIVGTAGLVVASGIALPKTEVLGLILSACFLAGAEAMTDESLGLAWLGTLLFSVVALGAASVLRAKLSCALLLVPVGSLHAFAAFRRRAGERTLFVAIATLVGFVGECVKLARLPRHDLWLVSVAVGIALLVIASMVESRAPRLERGWSGLRRHFSKEDSDGDSDLDA